MEIRISPGGRRFLAPKPAPVSASLVWGDSKLAVIVDDLVPSGQISSGRKFQRLQNEKNALYDDLFRGDPAAAENIQMRILAQIQLLKDKLAAGTTTTSSPMSKALVPVLPAR